MLKNKEIIIGKYLSGNADPKETKLLMDWLKEDPSHQSEFDRIQKFWDVSLHLKKEKDADVESAWAQFKELTGSKKETKKLRPLVLRVAAAVTLFIIMGILVKLFFMEPGQVSPKAVSHVIVPEPSPIVPEISVSVPDTISEAVIPVEEPVAVKTKTPKRKVKRINTTVSMITISTGDSAKIFMLPDNSIVYLNAHSKLEYPENFNKTQRRVALTGEAFFEVAKDSNLFIVSCQKTITRGAGTSFNIKSYQEDKDVEVIVVTGQAEFSGIGYKEFKKLVLKPGETGSFNKENTIVTKMKHTRKNYKWWQKRSLKARIKMFFDKLRNKMR
jgi:transmembrane sensor